jgi:hypothetical protein
MTTTFQVTDATVPEWFHDRRPETKMWNQHPEVSKQFGDTTRILQRGSKTVGGASPLFQAFSYAFNQHCPLILRPDDIWLTVLGGVARHITTDPEAFRQHFVDFEGKEVLTASAGLFGYESLIPQFAEKLEGFIGKKRNLIECGFTTTTDIDKIASQIALMGAMQHYFDYKGFLCCNYSTVTLEGTPEDWGNLVDRSRYLGEIGFDFWTDHMTPVLEQFVKASEGNPDIDFWRRAYLKQGFGSGGDFNVSGWVNAFYPYINGKVGQSDEDNGWGGNKPVAGAVRNPFVDWENHAQKSYRSFDQDKPEGYKGGYDEGVNPDDFPFGLVKVPVQINDNGVEKMCEFYGGLVGVSMGEDFTVQPVSGYAVRLVGEGCYEGLSDKILVG